MGVPQISNVSAKAQTSCVDPSPEQVKRYAERHSSLGTPLTERQLQNRDVPESVRRVANAMPFGKVFPILGGSAYAINGDAADSMGEATRDQFSLLVVGRSGKLIAAANYGERDNNLTWLNRRDVHFSQFER